MGPPHRGDHRRQRQGALPPGKRRGPQVLERTRHQDRRLQVFLRRRHHRQRPASGRPRAIGPPAHPPRHPHHRRLGPRGRLLRQRSERGEFLSRPDLALPAPVRRVQLAGLVQRGPLSPVRRRQGRQRRQLALGSGSRQGAPRARPVRVSAGQRLLHPERQGQHGGHHAPRHSEAMLFKFGSGTGTDLSTLRSSREKLSGGGKPSGPLSFLRIYDQVANVVKSGGKTRRAAKMNTLKDWHPDIEEFIEAKTIEEKKAWALIEQGYDGSYNGDAYGSVMFQNENLSVRVSDEFMKAAVEGDDWWTRRVTDGEPLRKEKRPRAAAQDRAGHLDLRRSRRAVRHHHPHLAHLQGQRPPELHQPLLRVHVPQRHRLQPRLAQPDEVPAAPTARSTSSASKPPSACSSSPRKSSSTTPAIRPSRSPRTPTSSARSASATPTSARSS